MTLRLVASPEPVRRPIATISGPSPEMVAAARALGLAHAAVTHEHLRRMMTPPLRLATRTFGCTHPEARGLRLVEEWPEPSADERLVAAEEAITKALAGPELGRNEGASVCFRMARDEIVRLRPKLSQEAERNAELRGWEFYRERWRASDLPEEPELRRVAKRGLVEAGYWQLELLGGADRAEIAAADQVGPKALAQIDALLEARGLRGLV